MAELAVDMCVVVGALAPLAVGEWVYEFVCSRKNDRTNSDEERG